MDYNYELIMNCCVNLGSFNVNFLFMIIKVNFFALLMINLYYFIVFNAKYYVLIVFITIELIYLKLKYFKYSFNYIFFLIIDLYFNDYSLNIRINYDFIDKNYL